MITNYNSLFRVLWLTNDNELHDFTFHANDIKTYEELPKFINSKLKCSQFVALSIRTKNENWERIGRWSESKYQ